VKNGGQVPPFLYTLQIMFEDQFNARMHLAVGVLSPSLTKLGGSRAEWEAL
jgi:hypothetical protein